MLSRLLIAFFASLLLAAQSSAAVVNVLVVDRQKGSGNEAFVSGGRYSNAFTDLTDPNRFGIAGTVGYSLNFLDSISSLTSSTQLDGVGLILFAHTHNAGTSASEVALAKNFVTNGGSLLSLGFANVSDDNFNSFSSAFAARTTTRSGGLSNSAVPTYLTPASSHAVLSTPGAPATPFGLSSSILNSDANVYLIGSTLPATDQSMDAVSSISFTTAGSSITRQDGLYGSLGAGRFLLVGSANAFGTGGTYDSTLLASKYNHDGNQAYFLNSVAWLTEGSTTAVPEPSSLTVLSLGLVSAGWLRLTRRRKNLLG